MYRSHAVRLLTTLSILTVITGISPASAQNNDLTVSASYTLREESTFAAAEARFNLNLHGDRPRRVALLPVGIPLLSVHTSTRKIAVSQKEGHYIARLPHSGKFEITLRFRLPITESAGVRSVNLPLMEKAVNQVSLHLGQPGMAVRTHPATPTDTVAHADTTTATLYPAGRRSISISWFPEELDVEPEAVFETVESSIIDLIHGAVARETLLTLNIRRGGLEWFEIGIPPGVDVLDVERYQQVFGRRQPTHEPSFRNTEDIDSWHTEGTDSDRRLIVFFRRAVKEPIVLRISSEQRPDPDSDTFTVEPFEPSGADRRRGQIMVMQAPEHKVVTDVISGMNRTEEKDIRLFPSWLLRSQEIAAAYEFHRLPASLHAAARPLPPRITASVQSHVRFQEGLVDMESHVRFRAESRAVDSLRLALEEGLMVLSVEGPKVTGWEVADAILHVRLTEPVKGEGEFTLSAVEHLRRIDGVLAPKIRVKDAERQEGSVGLSTTEDIGLVHREAVGYRQVDTTELSDWLRSRRPELAYTYELSGERDARRLALSTRLIRPELNVEGVGVAIIGEEAVEEEYMFSLEISRRPMFRLMIRLPEGLTPVNLFGDRVADWEYHPESGVIAVRFDRGLLGATRIQLFGERRRSEDPSTVFTGGVTVSGADHLTGFFGVGTDANLDLQPISVQSAVPIDARRTHALISTHDAVNTAFKWSGEDWGIICSTESLEPLISTETDTQLVFGVGIIRARTDITLNIERASVQELHVELPEGAVPGDVDGMDVQDAPIRDGRWAIRLADPVRGEHTLSLHYELSPEQRGERVNFGGVRLPQAHRQRGALSAFTSDPRLEVSVSHLENFRHSAPADTGHPDELPSLGTYSYTRPERRIEFDLRGHIMDAGVRLRADEVDMASVLKRKGGSVHYMRCRLQNAGEQYFSFRLPENTLLWGTYVGEEPVRPIVDEQNTVFVPLLDTPREKGFDLAVIWSQPSERQLGTGASVSLRAPELDLPVQEVRWNLHVPREYRIISSRGNMELLRRDSWYEHGLPGAVYQRVLRAWPAIRFVLLVLALITAVVSVPALVICIIIIIGRRLGPLLHGEDDGRLKPILAAVRSGRWVLMGLLIVLVLAVLASMLMPALGRARSEARSAASSSNLRQIGLAIAMYRGQYAEQLPPDLETLLEAGFIDNEQLLISPTTGERYRYIGPIDTKTAGPDTPLAWDAPDERGGRVTLFMDTSVRYVRADERLAGRAEAAIEDFADYETAADFREGFERDPYAEERDVLGMRRRKEPEPEEAGPPAPREWELERRAEMAESAVQRHSYERARQQVGEMQRNIDMAESYRRRGLLDEAEKELRQVLEIDPESAAAQRGLDRIQRLQQDVDVPADQMEDLDTETRRSYALGALMTYSEQFDRELDEGWRAELPATGDEQRILTLASGLEDTALLPSGARAEHSESELIVTGTETEVERALEAASALQARMAEEARQLTQRRRRLEEEVAARRRAEARRRQAVQQTRPTASTGMVSTSRAAGPLPIEIAFPAFDTERYPFHMDYAGTAQPRLEVTCLRSGVAMVLQGALAALAWLLICLTAWRAPRAGLGLGVVSAAMLMYMLHIGAADQYAVMALAGVILALPLVMVRLSRKVRGKLAQQNI